MTDREKQLTKLLQDWHDYATSTIRQVNDQWIEQLVAKTGEAVSQEDLTEKINEKK